MLYVIERLCPHELLTSPENTNPLSIRTMEIIAFREVFRCSTLLDFTPRSNECIAIVLQVRLYDNVPLCAACYREYSANWRWWLARGTESVSNTLFLNLRLHHVYSRRPNRLRETQELLRVLSFLLPRPSRLYGPRMIYTRLSDCSLLY